eukprot:5434428-Prorocentrum_lima.AAC.1
MTSSLVGSEMCIRDRTFLGVGQLRPWRPWLNSGTVAFAAATALAAPVSYTHLTLPTICSV